MLDLQYNKIGAVGAKAFAVALNSNSSLHSLNLNYNYIGDEGAKALKTALKSNSSLQMLDLHDNHIRSKEAKALNSNSSLHSLLTIAEYQYIYGGASGPNRKIVFQAQNNEIIARINVKNNGVWKEVSQLTEDKITKEGASTSEKVSLMVKATEKGVPYTLPPDITFASLSLQEKTTLIQQLQPNGVWSLGVSTYIGDNLYHETVTRLHFFNPQ